jgi:Uma2 family endonuclease
MSLAQFLELPEKKPALEYEDGVVTRKAMPKSRHARLQLFLARLLDLLVAPGGRWYVFVEQRCTFGDRSVVPDVTVIRSERLPVGPDGELLDDFLAPPDLAVEILSPRQSVAPALRRCQWYVENGVTAALMVDPDDKSVWLFKPDSGAVALRGGTRIELADVIPGFTLTPTALFDSLKVR